MKKIFLALIFTFFGAFFSMSAYADSPETALQEDRIIRQQPVEEGLDRQRGRDAVDYFFSCLPVTEYGSEIYPDTYGGYRFDDNGDLAIQVTSSDLSEYLFLQEEFPCIVFEQVEYSYNYLVKLRDEYIDAYLLSDEGETVYGGGIDMERNCAYIEVDEETLLRKTNVPGAPLEFRLGFPFEFYTGSVEEELSDSDKSETGAVDEEISDSSDLPENSDQIEVSEPIEEDFFDLDMSETGAVDEREIGDSSAPSVNSYQISVKGGQILDIRRLNEHLGQCTAGIGCTTASGKNGLVICGHSLSVDDFVFLDDVWIGSVTFVQCSSDGLGDYGIVTLFDGVVADGSTYCLNNTIRSNYRVYEPKKDDKLFKFTFFSGFSQFVVVDTNFTITYNIDGVKVELKEMFKAKFTSGYASKGDSGAGIYHNSRDGDFTSLLEFSGILSGGDDIDPVTGKPSYIIFTPPKHIKNCTINHI